MESIQAWTSILKKTACQQTAKSKTESNSQKDKECGFALYIQ